MKRNEPSHNKDNRREPKGNVVSEESTSTRSLVSNELSNVIDLDDNSSLNNLSSPMTSAYDTNPMSRYGTSIMETDPEKIWISPDLILDSSKV